MFDNEILGGEASELGGEASSLPPPVDETLYNYKGYKYKYHPHVMNMVRQPTHYHNHSTLITIARPVVIMYWLLCTKFYFLPKTQTEVTYTCSVTGALSQGLVRKYTYTQKNM